MWGKTLFSLCTALLLLGECIHVPETRHGRLEVIASDLTGAPISNVKVELTPMGGGKTIKSNSTIRVLYGGYEMRAYARGFASARRELRIGQPDTIVRVELAVGSIGCPDPPRQIGGRIRRNDTSGELWVKAVPIRGVVGGEGRVDNSGYFLISGLEVSTYLVIVMHGETVLHQEVVKTFPVGSSRSSELDIDLGARK
jgi:hypothetical protein